LQYDLFLFFAYAGLYFTINSVLVSGAISISHGKRFREVWSLNTRGILAYDLGASVFAILLAWFYIRSQEWVPFGLGSVSLLAVIFPVVVLRHIYGMYHRLQQNGRELLEVMVKAIEARDPYTSGHSIRVAALSRGIAVEMGFSTKKLEEVTSAGLLHDVGKIHEEFAPLLRKADKLTDEEFALLQTHSLKSAELVGIITSFRGPIQAMVLSHHERWDGNGYPDGLAQEDIPIGSRIIMVSDTIDAMTTDRPYRKALPVDTVIAELQRCRGTQFDPAIVDLAVSSLGVRRMISEAGGEQEQGRTGDEEMLGRSKKVVWRDTFRRDHG
jgi:HD-GYP domain-containing protein (c-di-GMP phosphodiesterase class II)